MQRSPGYQFQFFQFVAHKSQRKGSAEHRDLDFSEQVWERPDMILMGMG